MAEGEEGGNPCGGFGTRYLQYVVPEEVLTERGGHVYVFTWVGQGKMILEQGGISQIYESVDVW